MSSNRWADGALVGRQARTGSSCGQPSSIHSYCYADGGGFGGPDTSMALATALASVDLLLADVAPGERVNLSFLGGEPMMNRAVVRAAAQRARELALQLGVTATFSITTNGTLLTADDGDFFEEYGFAVTVSLDGPRAAHDLLRPLRSGRKLRPRRVRP
jgi:uncharacterized protein